MSTNTTTLSEIGETVSEGLADAWAATAAFAQDLAAHAAGTASDLGAAATSGLSGGVERVGSLYEQALSQVRPRPRRRVNPWIAVIAVAVALLGVGWWRRRRAADVGTGPDRLSPVSDHREPNLAAATG